jgi:ELP3 family radical SAM enzyme/protein acetyltransferase
MSVDDENSIKTGGCPKNCYYCPFEKDANGIPTQPRSYLSTEPGNLRATENKHHPVGQMFARIYTLEQIGHISPFYETTSSKIDAMISGGTFNFYPREYIIWFTTCMYYAANIYPYYREHNKFPREPLSLEEEQKINEIAQIRIIGLTIETRPDYLDPNDYESKAKKADFTQKINTFEVIELFRELGVTRVQIGLQHTNDKVLKFVNRDCTNYQNKKAIFFLKQNGFKVDGHWMLDLPMPANLNAPEEDMKMLDEALQNPDLEVDQWKIYPTEVTPYTIISDWYHDGFYKPYAEIDNGEILKNVIIHAKKQMKPWIRINRVIRDIPIISIEGGIMCPNMRSMIENDMKKQNIMCKCIRCREVKLQKIDYNTVVFKKRHYIGSYGDEYFLSFETPDEKILVGYLRLRLNRSNNMVIDYLRDTALIRELHVLGKHTDVGNETKGAQHRGYGRRLIQEAEQIAINEGFQKIAIIAGVGVREYYRKFNYELENTYMTKKLPKPFQIPEWFIMCLFVIIAILIQINFQIMFFNN